MTIDWWTLGLQTINFVVLVWILARFLFRPVSRIIAERQAAAHAALDDAKAIRDQANVARETAQAEAEMIAARRAEMIVQAGEDATREKERLLRDARVEAEKARTEALADLNEKREVQARALSDKAAMLATDIAARLIARLPDEARITGFVDGLAEALAELPQATCDQIGQEGSITLRVARALSTAERDQVLHRLSEVLERPIELDIEIDETLLAGLELDAPHAIIRNHFRADLDRITADLTRHD